MGLLSFFKRHPDAPRATGGVGETGDAVQRARTRARQRLIGAAVLLGIGIVGFPLVFETQPRPIPVNIPIEAPAREGAPALTMPAARPPAAAPATAPATPPAAAPSAAVAPPASTPPRAAVAPEVITESREDAGREVAAPARAASKPVAPAAKPAAEPKPEPKVTEAKPAEPKPAADSARARALLEGKPEQPADAGRFVVQFGAFAEQTAARETRLKAEKLGFKTYAQVATTPAGKRIRVRAGPYNSRAEADKALAKARGAGLTAVVLTL